MQILAIHTWHSFISHSCTCPTWQWRRQEKQAVQRWVLLAMVVNSTRCLSKSRSKFFKALGVLSLVVLRGVPRRLIHLACTAAYSTFNLNMHLFNMHERHSIATHVLFESSPYLHLQDKLICPSTRLLRSHLIPFWQASKTIIGNNSKGMVYKYLHGLIKRLLAVVKCRGKLRNGWLL